ncbi:MAG TPA: aminopeptidase P family protein, partial [Candidatus Avimonas sp.]|nr:aminopeptidase P family protein [Candidatus Avimonas sp.]
YITGFKSSAGAVLVTRDKSYFLTDFRYIEAARRAIRDIDCVEYKKMADTLKEIANRHSLKTLAVEGSEITCSDLNSLKESLNGIELETTVLDDCLTELRLSKTKEELEKIKQAQALTDYGFEYILPRIKAGRTEREIALDLEFEIRRQGAEAAAFDFIVVSGANSSLPHGVPSDKQVEKGDFVTLDFGAVVDGWRSDMTRTVAVGSCSEEQREIYNIVLKAQLAALSRIKSGLSCREGDAAARDIIKGAGYGEYFGHGTGHGVGMEIHEAPRLSPSAEKDEILKEGTVVTVEPGIYIPGRFGVRIEDMVYITANGCENLTKSSKKLIIV